MNVDLRRVIAFGVPALGCAVTLVAGWPGGISPDMANTLSEGRYFIFSGHQSPMFSLLWALPLAVLPFSVTIAIGYVLQSCAYWAGFGLLAHGSLRRGSPAFAVLAAFAGFIPSIFAFTVMIESNVQTGVAWSLAIALAYAFPSRRTLLACLPLVFCGYCARYGTSAAVVPVLYTCFAMTSPRAGWPRAIRHTAITTAAMAIVSAAVVTVFLGSPSTNRNLAIWFLGDIARVYQLTGTHCIPPAFVPTTTAAEAIMAEFNPSQPTETVWVNKQRFLVPESDAALNELRKCWLRTIRRSPREFLRAKGRYALAFLMVGVEWAPATTPDYTANTSLGLATPNHQLSTSMKAFVEGSRTSLVWKGWFWLLAAGLACGFAAFRHPLRGAVVAIYVAAVGALIPHFVASLGALSRQFFPSFILLVTCILVAGGGRRDRTTNESPPT